MKKYNFIIPAFLLLIWAGFSGCEKKKESEKEPQYEIYEDHEVSACGIDDPLRNIGWLNEYYTDIKQSIEAKSISIAYISLFKLVNTDEHIFKIFISNPMETPKYLHCNGDTVDEKEMTVYHGQSPMIATVPPPPDPSIEFIAYLFYFLNQ